MKKHLGWLTRMLIALLGIGYILYTLNWSDRIFLPAGYVTDSGLVGADEWFRVIDETRDRYTVRRNGPSRSGPYDVGDVPKSQVGPGEGQLRFEPSFFTILRQSNKPQLVYGGLLLLPVVLLTTLRWWVLMRARGIEIGLAAVGRLTLAGYFFNLCMPGTTGGDLMKAYYAARGTDRRADAVVSIGIDRLCGLIGLVLLVGVIGLFSLDHPLIRKLTMLMWLGLVAVLAGAFLYTSPAVRRGLRLGETLGKLPGSGALRKIDGWISAYRHHKAALVLAIAISVSIHVCVAGAMSLAGFALGVDQSAVVLLSVIPIVMVLWSLPVSGPLGLGPMDFVAVQLVTAGSASSDQQALMMFVAFRLYLVAVGLLGSFALMGLGAKKVPGELQDTPLG